MNWVKLGVAPPTTYTNDGVNKDFAKGVAAPTAPKTTDASGGLGGAPMAAPSPPLPTPAPQQSAPQGLLGHLATPEAFAGLAGSMPGVVGSVGMPGVLGAYGLMQGLGGNDDWKTLTQPGYKSAALVYGFPKHGGDELRNGLIGAGIGAGVGGLYGAFQKRRRPLSGMLAGGLVGGALGAGGTALYDHLNPEGEKPPEGVPPGGGPGGAPGNGPDGAGGDQSGPYNSASGLRSNAAPPMTSTENAVALGGGLALPAAGAGYKGIQKVRSMLPGARPPAAPRTGWLPRAGRFSTSAGGLVLGMGLGAANDRGVFGTKHQRTIGEGLDTWGDTMSLIAPGISGGMSLGGKGLKYINPTEDVFVTMPDGQRLRHPDPIPITRSTLLRRNTAARQADDLENRRQITNIGNDPVVGSRAALRLAADRLTNQGGNLETVMEAGALPHEIDKTEDQAWRSGLRAAGQRQNLLIRNPSSNLAHPSKDTNLDPDKALGYKEEPPWYNPYDKLEYWLARRNADAYREGVKRIR